MKVTNEPVENINFDWCNYQSVPIKKRLPRKFLKLCVDAHVSGNKYVDYHTGGGNRIVARLTDDGHIDYIINPEPEMLLGSS
jgi:hypothetical protein